MMFFSHVIFRDAARWLSFYMLVFFSAIIYFNSYEVSSCRFFAVFSLALLLVYYIIIFHACFLHAIADY